MKYENLKEANDTAKRIKKLERELALLSEYDTGSVKIIITAGNELSTKIAANATFEHPYRKCAEVFVSDMSKY